jgi:hypothetical protein
MDEIVKQAMAKWPNVPHCYGWLGLDARGNWYMRDDGSQSQGAFASGVPGAKGSRLQHVKLIEFIQRNYAADDIGQWYFQNGPQRVYVELEITPWVWRVSDDFQIAAHDGTPVQWHCSLVDQQGRLYCETSKGFGLVHTQDVAAAANAIEQGLWTVSNGNASQFAKHFDYVRSPQLLQESKKPAQ